MAHELLYNTFGYTGEIRMVNLVEALTLVFIVFSLLLIILVPLTYATREEAENLNDTIKGLGAFWVILLLAIGIANTFSEKL